MSIVINENPLAINPAYREVKFRATSDDSTIKAIRADLYIGGTYSSTINGTQVLGQTDQFNFDISKIMQSDLVSELRTSITSFAVTDAVISAKTIKMRFFEVLLTGGVYVTTWAANGAGTGFVESGDYDIVNMATQHQETLADWTVDDATKELLTERSDNNKIPRGVPFQIGFLSSDTNFVANAITRDSNLNQITDSTTGIVLSSLTSSKGIIEVPSNMFSSSNVAFIDIKLRKDAVGDRSITYRYKVQDYCDKFTIFFQNHLGDFDHFDFGNKVKTEVSTTNQRMKKPLLGTFSPEDAGIVTVSSITKTKVVVNTFALSASELVFLSDLIKNHSVVYKWDSAGVFLRYVVKSHSKKIDDNDILINTLQITLEPSNEHITQKGD